MEATHATNSALPEPNDKEASKVGRSERTNGATTRGNGDAPPTDLRKQGLPIRHVLNVHLERPETPRSHAPKWRRPELLRLGGRFAVLRKGYTLCSQASKTPCAFALYNKVTM